MLNSYQASAADRQMWGERRRVGENVGVFLDEVLVVREVRVLKRIVLTSSGVSCKHTGDGRYLHTYTEQILKLQSHHCRQVTDKKSAMNAIFIFKHVKPGRASVGLPVSTPRRPHRAACHREARR